jgi:hypothetical protein
MTVPRLPLRLVTSALFALSLAGVSAAGTESANKPKSANKGVNVMAASAPAGTDVRIKRALSDAIRTQVGEAGLTSKLSSYSIVPALIQLQRVTGSGQEQPRTVCTVELSLQHSQRGLVANVRGNASGVGGTQLEMVHAAAHAAVDRLPETLSALQDMERRPAPR